MIVLRFVQHDARLCARLEFGQFRHSVLCDIMSETKQVNALFKAIKAGDVAKTRELLTAGVSIESPDPNKLTPVMLAAQAGQRAVFDLLVERGAHLDGRGFGDTDVLECAAEGGHVEIIQFLLAQGHPVEGRWKARSKVDEREGHMTPLYLAALNAHVDAVRVLLAAGAKRDVKYDGTLLLKTIEQEIKFPNFEEDVARVPRWKEIVAMMKGSPAQSQKPERSVEDDVKAFAANALRPEYKKLHKALTERCGPAQKWKPVPDHGIAAKDVVRFTLAGCKKQKDLDAIQTEARNAGCHLVLNDLWLPGEDAKLVLFPTDNKFAVVAAVGTEGANHGVQTSHVLDWLKELDAGNPFHLTYCGHDFVGGTFIKSVKKADELAESMAEFCPDCLDEEIDSAEILAMVLKKQKSFFLRWG